MRSDVTVPNVAIMPSSFAPHVGGVEELSRQLAKNLKLAGSRVVIITNRYPRQLPPKSVHEGIEVRRTRFRFPEPRPRHLGGWILGTAATRREISNAIDAHESAVIHVQCVSSNGYYALRAARRAQLPLVVSLHGELTMDANHLYQRSATMRRTWRQLVDAANVVTGCSAQVVGEALDFHGPGLSDKIRIVGNGVDLHRVRSAIPESRPRPYVLGIGRLVHQKGFDNLIRSFRRLLTTYPDLDLLIAGDGPEAAALDAIAQSLQQPDRVHLLGAVEPDRVYRLLRGASAFVLSSRHEPQGIVLLEAMAARVPVIATDVGGVAETIRHGINGLLVPSDDPAEMATAIESVLNDPQAAGQRVEAACDFVAKRGWDRVTDAYLETYQDAILAHRHASKATR